MASADPVEELINQVLGRRWIIVPHLNSHHRVDHVLVRHQGLVTDLVTLSIDGLFQVARLDGAFDRNAPLRVPVVRWLYYVPGDVALSWALGNTTEDDLAIAASGIWIDPPLFATRWQRGLWVDHEITDRD